MTVKYITENGVRKLNPAWKALHRPQQQPQGGSGSGNGVELPFGNRDTALAIVSYPNQKDLFSPDDEEIVVAPSYQKAVDDYRGIMAEAEIVIEPEITVEGQDNNNNNNHGLGKLAEVLAKYEIPAGMLSKLLELRNFQVAEIIVDDSSSMNARTDAKGPQGENLTRWEEAKLRVLQMMELIAYVTAPKMVVRFLNRSTTLELQREKGESPSAFYERVKKMVEDEFYKRANGLTPALECIQQSLSRYPGQKALRYFMGDGVPNGGEYASKQIAQLLVNRPNPEMNPFTFMSCTNEDAATEWMKECEEAAPYCAELDDYMDESREILRDQGKAFPYSFGLHLVAQIVAAFNPHDLDAMDESVPFTKPTLEDLLGYRPSDAEYKYYFDSFLEAQRKLPNKTPAQQTILSNLPGLYPVFVSTPRAADIPEVAEYKQQMKAIVTHKQRQTRQVQYQPQPGAGQQAECCAIL